MRKRIIADQQDILPADHNWLDLNDLAEVELTSEDPGHPIESALLACQGSGWRAGATGMQTIRLIFRESQTIRRIRLVFTEYDIDRTQEYVLRWSKGEGQPFREIVRQQWNFSREGSQIETENHGVELPGVRVLELMIVPDIHDANVLATLTQLQVA